jgi:hypothetical protein
VLIRGDKELEVKKVEILFDEEAFNKVRNFFDTPQRMFDLHTEDFFTSGDLTECPLIPKKSVFFYREFHTIGNQHFIEKYGNVETNDEISSSIKSLNYELLRKYGINWTRYDGEKLCWKFPDTWWRNLGKKLWG